MARRVNGGIGIGFEEDGFFDEVGGSNEISSSSSSTPSSPPSSKRTAAVTLSPPPSAGAVASGGCNYFVHLISKLDTLAGVAIKYGVEVADIRRINGLVTDRQMFALKTLRIPLPGRHPPSPILPNGFDSQGESSSEKTPNRRRHSDIFDTFQSLKLKPSSQQNFSPSISSLQDYYRLKTVDEKCISEGFEMTPYRNGGAHYLDDGHVAKPSSPTRPLGLHRKCKSVANGLVSENGDLPTNGSTKESKDGDSDKWIGRLLVRRRQKSEADFTSYTPQLVLKEENRGGGTFSDLMFKGLGGFPKTVNGFFSGGADAAESGPTPVGMGDSFIYNVVNGFRKSSSTSSLQESDNNTLLSLWPTSKWSLKPDLNALSAAAITKPIFDGIPNPMSGRKNKAAVD